MILIVDDDVMMRQVLEIFLESHGFSVLTAGDGNEALKIYSRHGSEIQVILCDIEIPNLSGVEAYRQLKTINPEVKVIFGSGFLDPQTRAHLTHEGARHFLHKPYKPEDILLAIRSALES
ncbi:MAG: response regulator [Ignavibacteriales bacterium]|nr:response regulator [Ignavibacteriales bacterium]